MTMPRSPEMLCDGRKEKRGTARIPEVIIPQFFVVCIISGASCGSSMMASGVESATA